MEALAKVPTLPLEIVTLILQQLTGDDGMLLLWLVCRHLSKTWRLLVEHIFITRELPVTSIMFSIPGDIKEHGHDPDDWKNFDGLYQFKNYTYDRFQVKNGKIALFALETSANRRRRQYQNTHFRYSNLYIAVSGVYKRFPLRIVRSRRMANDTEITGCYQEEKSKNQLSCDWRSMLTNLLVEEYRVQRRTIANVSKHDLRIAYDPSWLIEENMTDNPKFFCYEIYKALQNIQDCRDDSQRDERRLRIAAKQNTENPGKPMTETTAQENSALEQVLRDRSRLLFTEFDDDEHVMRESRCMLDEQDNDDNDDWAAVERERINCWWLDEASDIADEVIEPADREKKLARLAKKMKQIKLWWREAEVSEDSSHLIDEEQVDHKQEQKADALPEMIGTPAVGVSHSTGGSEDSGSRLTEDDKQSSEQVVLEESLEARNPVQI
ncbi:hypothetical protein MMC11_006114 [Xylographa trunciseda]|nr:hypothetical protein [Xylographa trunciseda]